MPQIKAKRKGAIKAMKGTTTLTSVDIRNVGEANAVFGSDTSVRIILPIMTLLHHVPVTHFIHRFVE